MQVALIQVCVDDRLNHELLRIQVRHKLAEHYIKAKRVMIVNEIGGNFGANFRNTAKLVQRLGDEIVYAAVLHHDDCRAEKIAARRPLDETLAEIGAYLAEQNVSCTVSSGNIYTGNNHIIWLEDREVEAIAHS